MQSGGGLLEGGPGAEGDYVGATISNRHPKRNWLEDCSVH